LENWFCEEEKGAEVWKTGAAGATENQACAFAYFVGKPEQIPMKYAGEL
jgi:hypothetical protein